MTRRRLATAATAIGIAALGPALAASSAAAPGGEQGENLAHRIIKVVEEGPNRIVTVGGWHPDPRADDPQPTIDEAVDRFGTPTSAGVEDGACKVVWEEIGVTVWFALFGLGDPCEDGRPQRITIGPGEAARGWKTNRDIYIRSATRRARDKYPARYEGAGRYSLLRQSAPGEGTADLLVAHTSQQVETPRVQSFELFPLAAGD